MSNMMNAASYTIYDVRNDASFLTPKSSKAQLSFPPMAKHYYDYITDMSISYLNKKKVFHSVKRRYVVLYYIMLLIDLVR